MIKIPSTNKKWSQANNSDLFGNVYVTKNITFDKSGYLKLSNSPRAVMNPSIDADFDNSAAIVRNDYSSPSYYIGTWDRSFNVYGDILSLYPTEITTSGVPATDIETGAIWFDGKIIVTQDTDVDYYEPTTDTWVDTNITLTSSGQHQLVNFVSLSALAVCDVNTVKLYQSPITATPILIRTLVIPSNFEITGACYFNQKMFIGTRDIYGGHSYIYVWNGTSEYAQEAYEIDSNVVLDITTFRNSVVCFSGNGELLRYNGSGFSPLPNGKFPNFYYNQNLVSGSIPMYKNMLKSNTDVLYINFTNTGNQTSRILNMPDGIWCYDEDVGLYHRYSTSISLMDVKTVSSTAISATTNIITTTNVPTTGTEIYFSEATNATGIGGLTLYKKYFVIKVSATEMKLATTKENALSGTSVDITSVATGTYYFTCYPNVDYGSYWSGRTHAINVIDKTTERPQFGVDLLWGSEAYTRTLSTTNDEFLYTVSPSLESRGYFITPKIISSGVKDNYNNLTLKFKKLNNELDKIIIKYRDDDDTKEKIDESEWVANWTSTTTFTSTQTDLANAKIGDEIEILMGAAGGLLAHITEITENSGTYTITIDEVFENYTSGDKSVFIYRNWKKLATISYGEKTAEDGFIQKQINGNGKFLQLKIELRGIGIEIEELQINNKTDLPN